MNNKSTVSALKTIGLAEMSTWQSGILQSSAHRRTKKLTDDYLKRYDLSTMHWLIIGTILESEHRGIRLTDLAEKIGTTMGYLTNAINTLVLRNMVVRTDDRDDSRTKTLTIHPDFAPKCEKIEAGMRDMLRKTLYSKMSRDELETYITVLQKLARLN
jgi:DNA-binding MarR family transcriptional regulator